MCAYTIRSRKNKNKEISKNLLTKLGFCGILNIGKLEKGDVWYETK